MINVPPNENKFDPPLVTFVPPKWTWEPPFWGVTKYSQQELISEIIFNPFIMPLRPDMIPGAIPPLAHTFELNGNLIAKSVPLLPVPDQEIWPWTLTTFPILVYLPVPFWADNPKEVEPPA